MTKTSLGYRCIKGGFLKTIKTYPNLYDKEFSEKQKLDENTLITPLTPEGSRIQYDINEIENIQDSSNYNLEYHMEIAQLIQKK